MKTTIAAAWAIAFLAAALHAQPADGGKGDLMAEMESLIASYPKELWEPMLTLSGHPAVLARLAKKEPVIGQSPAVKAAAEALAKEPEAAKALADDRAGAATLAKAYAEDKQKVLSAIASQAQIESKATDEWAKRLGQDADAIDQLKAALKAYQQHPGATVSAEDAAAEAGVSSSGGAVQVNALPSPGFASYVMSNADVYPALSDTMVSQWLGGRNSWAYDHHFNHWWDHFHHNLDAQQFFHHDEHRADRLADAARYDRSHAKDEHRWDHFHDHRNEHQHLGKVNSPPKDHKEAAGKPHVDHGGEHHVNRKADQHHQVHRGHPQPHHQTHHAAAAHHHSSGHRR